MNPNFSRRKLLRSGLGGIAFASLATQQALAESKSPIAAKEPHFAPRAKNVIQLFMRGAPSQVDTFDYKPKLNADHGKPGKSGRDLLGSPFEFNQHGESGLWISELFPNVAKHADEICLINGMHCDVPNHLPAVVQSHTGSVQFIRPSMGAWTLYGLGTENTDIPGFIVLGGGEAKANFGSAFLPAYNQGTVVGSGGGRRQAASGPPTVPNIRNQSMDLRAQRQQLDFVNQLNRNKLARDRHSPEVEGMIQSMELAFRMQSTMPNLLDYSGESAATLKAYGVESGAPTEEFGKNCLLARRMIERGVRFVEVMHSNWDQHDKLREDLSKNCLETDQPIAALIQDLKHRGMLADTLIIWGGEFGRTPTGERGDGRGHNSKGYTTWMAGGGVKGGLRYGATDEYGYEAVDGKMHIHDWHATILHLLGLDHKRLTFNYAGRDFRLTDVHGKVAKAILA